MLNIVIITFAFVINSCAITQDKLWGNGHYDETFKGYAVNENKKEILIRGEKYDYVLNDDSGNLINIINLVNKSQLSNLVNGLGDSYLVVMDPKITGHLSIQIRSKSLSKEQINELESMGFIKRNYGEHDYSFHPNIYGNRQDLRINKDFQDIITFHKSFYYEGIIEKPTLLKTTGLILLTPFAMAADILLMPITIPARLYHSYRESQETHFCTGEFCNYNKSEKK